MPVHTGQIVKTQITSHPWRLLTCTSDARHAQAANPHKRKSMQYQSYQSLIRTYNLWIKVMMTEQGQGGHYLMWLNMSSQGKKISWDTNMAPWERTG